MSKLLVLWDGDCGFCKQSLDWLKRQNLQGEIQFISFHDKKVASWKKKIGTENLQKSMHVIENNKNIYAYAEGFRILFSRSPKWKWLSFLMGLPLIKQCCHFGYTWIANNRFRLSKHVCKLH